MVERLLAVLVFLGIVTGAGIVWERQADLRAEIVELRARQVVADASMAAMRESLVSLGSQVRSKVNLETVESQIESGDLTVPWSSIVAPPGCSRTYAYWVPYPPPPPPGGVQSRTRLFCASPP